MYVTSRPRSRKAAADDSPQSSFTSTRMQLARSSARRVRITRLMPPAAPVTIATLPSKSAPKCLLPSVVGVVELLAGPRSSQPRCDRLFQRVRDLEQRGLAESRTSQLCADWQPITTDGYRHGDGRKSSQVERARVADQRHHAIAARGCRIDRLRWRDIQTV